MPEIVYGKHLYYIFVSFFIREVDNTKIACFAGPDKDRQAVQECCERTIAGYVVPQRFSAVLRVFGF